MHKNKKKKCNVSLIILEDKLWISDDGFFDELQLSSTKKSWGIRISLNTTKSIQVFNEILLISFCYLLKNTTRIFFIIVKCRFGEGTRITDDGFFDELQLSSNKKSWGTISSIKLCRQLSMCLILRIQKFPFTIPQREIKK